MKIEKLEYSDWKLIYIELRGSVTKIFLVIKSWLIEVISTLKLVSGRSVSLLIRNNFSNSGLWSFLISGSHFSHITLHLVTSLYHECDTLTSDILKTWHPDMRHKVETWYFTDYSYLQSKLNSLWIDIAVGTKQKCFKQCEFVQLEPKNCCQTFHKFDD